MALSTSSARSSMDLVGGLWQSIAGGAANNEEHGSVKESKSPQPTTYDVEEYSRVVTGKGEVTDAAGSASSLLRLVPLALTSPKSPLPPPTEHLQDFWKDEYVSPTAANNPTHNLASTGGSRTASPRAGTLRSGGATVTRLTQVSAALTGSTPRETEGKPQSPLQDFSSQNYSGGASPRPSQSSPTPRLSSRPASPEMPPSASPLPLERSEEEPERATWGTREGDMNIVLALCIVYIALRRNMKQRIMQRKEEAAAIGKKLDDVLRPDEREALERKHYRQFKKLLLQGIKLRLHTPIEAFDVVIKVDGSRRNLLVCKSPLRVEKVPMESITEIKRGKVTSTFKKKEKMKGLPASRCFSLVSRERTSELDFEVVPDTNSLKVIETTGGSGGANTDKATDAPSMSTRMLLDSLTGSESYLNDRKFYVNGFERLNAELNGAESFWWDPNGSLRKVTLSAFDETMLLQRKMGILDLDESEAEKKRRMAEEARERKRIALLEQKAIQRKLQEDLKEQKKKVKQLAMERRELEKQGRKLRKARINSLLGMTKRSPTGEENNRDLDCTQEGNNPIAENENSTSGTLQTAHGQEDSPTTTMRDETYNALHLARKDELERKLRMLEDAKRQAERDVGNVEEAAKHAKDQAQADAERRIEARHVPDATPAEPRRPSAFGLLGLFRPGTSKPDEPENEKDDFFYESPEEDEEEDDDDEDEEDDDDMDDGSGDELSESAHSDEDADEEVDEQRNSESDHRELSESVQAAEQGGQEDSPGS